MTTSPKERLKTLFGTFFLFSPLINLALNVNRVLWVKKTYLSLMVAEKLD